MAHRRRSIKYTEILDDILKDPKEAAAYLEEALRDEDPRLFLVALKNVARAQGIGMSALAQSAP